MQPIAYPARVKADKDGRIVVTFRDLPGATDGADYAQAMAEAIDFVESALGHYVYHGMDVPTPSSPRRNEILVRPSAVTAAQVALYTAMRRENVSAKDLAKRLGRRTAEIRGLIDLAAYPPLEHIERALAALGHRITITLEAAE